MPKKGFKHSQESIMKMQNSHSGIVFSEEHKKKISERTKRELNPNYGKHHSLEVRKIISDCAKQQWIKPETHERTLLGLKKRSENPDWRVNISKPKSLEHKKKIVEAMRNRISNPEYHKKLSQYQKKRFENKTNHPNYGKHLSLETRLKIGKSHKGKKLPPFTLEHKQKIGMKHKGKVVTEETKQKMRGQNNHFWRGGLTPLYLLIRNSAKYNEWRNAVFKRDNYCDCYSGMKGDGDLNAHHIVPFSTILQQNNIKTFDAAMNCDLLWDINNGITMVESNHIALHRLWGG